MIEDVDCFMNRPRRQKLPIENIIFYFISLIIEFKQFTRNGVIQIWTLRVNKKNARIFFV